MNNPLIWFWNNILIQPITNILIGFYRLFEWLHVPGPLGWAVILMTVTIRLVLYPLMRAQLQSAKKMQDLKPHLDALALKHKDDKAALQQAQMALYKEQGINPAAGCLPLIIQMPVLIALYNVFNKVLNTGNLAKVITDINKIVYFPALKLDQLNLNFFGINLAIKPNIAFQPNQLLSHGWLLIIPVITGLLQWYQTKLMMPKTAAKNPVPEIPVKIQNQKQIQKVGEVKPENKKSDTDAAAEMQQQMAIISPLMFAFFAFQFPLGLALYWNVFGLFGIMQQLQINKAK
jgi:YidC/Oxa1 family membrane protein insertase